MRKFILNIFIPLLAISQIFSPLLAEESINIGAVFALTGWAAIGGNSEQQATQMAVDEINAKGGVLGRQIKFTIEDNQSDLKKTILSIQKLSSLDNTKLILGPNWSEFTDVAAPYCEQNKILMLSSSGYSKTLTENRKYVFTILPAHSYVTEPISKLIVSKNHKKLALAVSNTAYFESTASALKDQLIKEKQKLASETSWNPGTTDFRSYISMLKNESYDAVIVFLLEGGDLAAFLRQAKELKLTSQVYSNNSILYDHVIQQNPNLMDGVIFYEYKNLAPKDFLERFKAKYTEVASHVVARSYDSVYLLKDAIERCNSWQPEVVKDCLINSKYRGVTGIISFDSKREVVPDGVLSLLYTSNNGALSEIH